VWLPGVVPPAHLKGQLPGDSGAQQSLPRRCATDGTALDTACCTAPGRAYQPRHAAALPKRPVW
jgi:hypothetical protein